MNGETTEYEKIIQIQFHSVTYLITIKAYPESLFIQLENKYTGQIWLNEWEPSFIEEITRKTGNYKKYNIFVKMLTTAFTKNSQSVYVDILTHHDIQMQNARRNPNFHKTPDPQIAQRRYIILSYMVEFDKVHYPLALNFNEHPDQERLKLTIRRLSEEIRENMGYSKVESSPKQMTVLKHENELLKSKLRSMNKHESKENQNSNYEFQINEKVRQIRELQAQKEEIGENLQQKNKQIEELKAEVLKSMRKMEEKDRRIEQLENKLEEGSKDNKNQTQIQQFYEKQINKIGVQVKELMSELQHSRQNEKKNKLKIANLEKQLQRMMELKTKSFSNRFDSPRKSERKSSNHSSLKGSLIKHEGSKNVQKKKNVFPRKKSSVFDSDTESSRMRKLNNNRASPFRQGISSNLSNSGKKNLKNTSRSKYTNFSNLNTNKNRSRSKSVKRQRSPQEITESSMMITEGGYVSDSDSDSKQRKLDVMNQLRNRQSTRLKESKNRLKKRNQEKQSNPLQDKISSIAEMLKKNLKQ